MRYGFTRFWADALVAIGMVLICLGAVGGIVGALDADRRLPTANVWLVRSATFIAGLVLGVVIGGPLIVIGQLVNVQLDQRALLAAHRRLLIQIRDALGPGATAAARRVVDRLTRRPE